MGCVGFKFRSGLIVKGMLLITLMVEKEECDHISAQGKVREGLETKSWEHFDREDLWKAGPQSCRELCWRVSASALTHRSEVPHGNLTASLPSLLGFLLGWELLPLGHAQVTS